MSHEMRRTILLYGDMNLNVMDGSAIWLISMAEALARTESTVHLQLKAPVTTDRLVRSLNGLSNLVVHDCPFESEMDPSVAAEVLQDLDARLQADLVIARGINICWELLESGAFEGRLWSYVTEVAYPVQQMSEVAQSRMQRIADDSFRVFMQTEEARSYVEWAFPGAAGKTLLLKPMIPDAIKPPDTSSDNTLKLAYAGKFAPAWRTLEMTEIPERLGRRGVRATVTMIGDKIHRSPAEDPTWGDRMRTALESSAVDWAGALPRDETLDLLGAFDVGLGWRSTDLDSSLELSTKLLEYAAVGTPPLLNRTRAHEELLGDDYPLFVNEDSVDEVVRVLSQGPETIQAARSRALEAVAEHRIDVRARQLEAYFGRAQGPAMPQRSTPGKTRVLVASHDLKFAGELVDLLEGHPEVELRFDHWETLHRNDAEASEALAEWADVILCEWAGPNAVWYSQRKRPGQRLVVRLHMFELRGAWLDDIDFAAVDQLVVVSDLARELIDRRLPQVSSKVVVVPNTVDVADLARPKTPGHEKRIGLVGIVPFSKRPDRATRLLEQLLEYDPEFTLHIKGRPPWEYPWEWKKPLQQQMYRDWYTSLSNGQLADSVVFEPFGPDIAAWLRKIGYVLSPSTAESFHLAPAEGMVTGAIPVFWERPGVREIFGDEFVVEDVDAAVRMIIEIDRNADLRAEKVASAMSFAKKFDLGIVGQQWFDLLFA